MAQSPFESHGGTIWEAFPGMGSSYTQTREGRPLPSGYELMRQSVNNGTVNTVTVYYTQAEGRLFDKMTVNPLGDEDIEIEAEIGRGGSGSPVFLVKTVEFVPIK